MTNIKVINSVEKSTKIIVPFDGLVTLDSEGKTEVTPRCAAELVKNGMGWSYVGKEPINVDENEGKENLVNNTEKSERQLLEEKLADSKLEEMHAMCDEAGFPKEEWEKLSKKLLSAYILKKFDEADEEEDDEEEDDEEEE